MKQAIEFSKRQSYAILALSLSSVVLILIASAAGILIPGTYFKETVNWTLQSMGQDLVNLLLIVPLFTATLVLTLKKNKIGFIIWGGINLYLVYTFVIYSFDIHFNRLFLAYCVELGLSFYSFLYFIYLSLSKQIFLQTVKRTSIRLTASYFFTIAFMFSFLWLSQIIPYAIMHTVPVELIETGLITNPVHVLDLAVFLPALLITSLLLSAKNRLGFLLAPVMLVFSVLMSFTIACLIYVMRSGGVETGYTVVIVMSLLTVMGMILFADYFKEVNTKTDYQSI